ncbi:nucleotide sugar dehydrogenase [Pseudomonadota bacterium]|nr:nucleotide sugar dehydrogenase [Pseudomonadota bacterium]
MSSINPLDYKSCKIAIVGLGYVGLPLAVEFSKIRAVTGFDIKSERVSELNQGIDNTLEVDQDEFKNLDINFTDDILDIKKCKIFIITVPTPINSKKLPNLEPLISATKAISQILKKGDLVIYESTVFPGATEEICGPILEKESQLSLNQDFYLGYSPERVNPGDKAHKIPNIVKVTSGSTPDAAHIVDELYSSIVHAGTFLAKSIKVAEAAKVIENTQRDLNIALMNELSLIFEILKIDTTEVLEAASTKWNFLNFSPGLVGGHCIGVDPYYLTYKAQEVGYQPEIILAGRKLNDDMSLYIANKFTTKLDEQGIPIKNARILVMGITFKENCPDTRNSKVLDLVLELKQHEMLVEVFDPWVQPGNFLPSSNVTLIENPKMNYYDGIILAVSHNQFIDLGIDKIKNYAKKKHIFFDLKSIFPINQSNFRL